jgi:hypothetical protein
MKMISRGEVVGMGFSEWRKEKRNEYFLGEIEIHSRKYIFIEHKGGQMRVPWIKISNKDLKKLLFPIYSNADAGAKEFNDFLEIIKDEIVNAKKNKDHELAEELAKFSEEIKSLYQTVSKDQKKSREFLIALFVSYLPENPEEGEEEIKVENKIMEVKVNAQH